MAKLVKAVEGQSKIKNRTLYHGDNLDFMRAMDSESVHLIATDPPFNKGRDFHATPDSLSDGAKFQDRWSWNKDVHDEWKEQIQDDWPGLSSVIESAEKSHSEGMAAFICWLSVRVLEMHRILRDDGSLYLHCDHTASAYIKAMLDSIFGHKNFKNEIVWWYYNVAVTSKTFFGQKHDTIFFYTKGNDWTFNADDVRIPYADNSNWVKNAKSYKDSRYAPNPKGKLSSNVFPIPTINNMSKERVGYPTQKPLKLYRRMIEASSNKGDVVFDPFAGCATTLIAAEQSERQWVGSDLWDKACYAVLTRLYREGLHPNSPEMKMSNEELVKHMRLESQMQLWFREFDVNYTNELPVRTDDGAIAAPYLKPVTKSKGVSPVREDDSARWLNERKKAYLIKQTGGMICWGCGREFDHEDYLELDHKVPRAERGANSLYNRALLCRPCNSTKRKGADLTLTGLRKKNNRDGFMKREIEIPEIDFIWE